MKNIKVIFNYLLIIFLFGCLQPDIPEEKKPELEIRQNNKPVSVIDIDPYMGLNYDEILYIYDLTTGLTISHASFTTNTNSIRVQRSEGGYLITGEKAGGMGIVKFEVNEKTAELRVFVRNWNKNEVFRHTMNANLEKYPFCPDTDYHSSHYEQNPPIANKLSAYQLIVDSGFHYEAPDGLSSRNVRNNVIYLPQTENISFGNTRIHADPPRETTNRKAHPVPHIFQRPDSFLNKDVFAFTLHFENDGDMVGGFEDRQRLELKTMDTGKCVCNVCLETNNQEPDNFMYSTGSGDTFTYRWKFKLPEDFRVSNEYTHIHQIKPEGGDAGNPTITLTGRRLRATGREVLQLIYRGPIRDNGDPSVNWYPAQVDLEPFKGEWIHAETTITFDNPGAYSIRLVRIRDMRILLEYIYSPQQYEELDPFVMFRNGNSYIRPKFGVYRRVMHMTPFGLPNPDNPVRDFLGENNEMTVLFADIEMDKLRR